MSVPTFPSTSAALVLAAALAAPLAASAADAMRVVLDPATGELRGPNAAEAAAFEKAQAALRAAQGKQPPKSAGPVEIRYPDGTVETRLGEDTMLYSVVNSAADGSLRFDCLPAKEARKRVAAAAKQTSSKTAARTGHDHK